MFSAWIASVIVRDTAIVTIMMMAKNRDKATQKRFLREPDDCRQAVPEIWPDRRRLQESVVFRIWNRQTCRVREWRPACLMGSPEFN